MPILWQEWSVWLPPGYELAGISARGPRSAPRQFTWSQRLFGPLGRCRGPSAADAGGPQTASAMAAAKSPWVDARISG